MILAKAFFPLFFVFLFFAVADRVSATYECIPNASPSPYEGKECQTVGSTTYNGVCVAQTIGFECIAIPPPPPAAPNPGPPEAPGGSAAGGVGAAAIDTITATIGEKFLLAIQKVIYVFFDVEAKLLGLAGFLLDWALNPNSYEILNYTSVYNGWQMVRDFLNMFFILVLLFSAFATIFQVDRFSLRNILLRLVIMALLVNFSFPITRFIIDMANVTMYFFLDAAFSSGGSASATILNLTEFAKTLVPPTDPEIGQYTYSNMMQLVMACVFIFVMMVTIGMLAMLMIIRLLVLTILLILSPIGFVFSAIPGIAKSTSGQWWDKLFNQAFFGPVMAFMLLLAVRLMQDIRVNGNFGQMARDYSTLPGTTTFLANATLHVIPMVFLWLAVAVAQQFKAVGAAAVVGAGTAAVAWGRKNWLGSRYIFRAGGAVAGATPLGRVAAAPKGLWSGVKARFVEPRREAREKWEERFKAYGKGGSVAYRTQKQAENDKLIEKKAREMREAGAGKSQLMTSVETGSAIEKAAAARVLSEKKLIDTADELGKVLSGLGDNVEQKKRILEASGKDVIKDEAGYRAVHSGLMSGIKPGANARQEQASLWNSLDKKLKDEDKAEVRSRVLQDSSIMTAHGGAAMNAQDAYKEVFGNMSAEQFAKQKMGNLSSDQNFQTYVRSNVAANPEYHQRVYERLGSQDMRTWHAQGLSPAIQRGGQQPAAAPAGNTPMGTPTGSRFAGGPPGSNPNP